MLRKLKRRPASQLVPFTITKLLPLQIARVRHLRVHGPFAPNLGPEVERYHVRRREWWTNAVLKTRRLGYGILEY